ncbi:hypothetical protein RW64_17180 [Geobacter sulfurreducens]|nr:hypothetical protein RW64_17180 [Geobacter sulfurreducens]
MPLLRNGYSKIDIIIGIVNYLKAASMDFFDNKTYEGTTEAFIRADRKFFFKIKEFFFRKTTRKRSAVVAIIYAQRVASFV